MPTTDRWYHYLSWFGGGAFLANFFPHFVHGVGGHPFQSPFAKPPGVGESSALSNVAWALFNLAVAYLLVVRVGNFELRSTRKFLPFFVGFCVMALQLGYYFARFHGG